MNSSHLPSPRTGRIVIAVLTLSALVGASALSGCGKLATLDQAPPMWGDKAKAEWSTSSDSNGGVTTTTSSSASRASERALPDGNGHNTSPTDPYKGNKPISEAPLEGFGNAQGH